MKRTIVVWRRLGKEHGEDSVLDLDELGNALEMGLITNTQMTRILTDTQKLIDLVRSGGFPPMELSDRQIAIPE